MRLIASISLAAALAVALRGEDIRLNKWPDDVPCDAVQKTLTVPTLS